ncbi:EAL and HDOD domain-containing protein [Thiomicrospira microaerophila]|uniref:EAL and HDOD domain-containing protein n=1 Tax=Thiomicrospira microaerophila TaxID=406020 RepID=UPI0005C91136|nr:HDOD domain-containing protein [Thiomicrospira microaerophila]
MSNLYIGRQPILNAQKEVFGYALKLYSEYGLSQNEIPLCAKQLTRLVAKLDLNSVTAGQPLFITLPRDLITELKLPQLLMNAHNVVVEIPEDVSADVDILSHLRSLKKQGIKIALGMTEEARTIGKLVQVCDFVKCTASWLLREENVAVIKAYKKPIIAECVDEDDVFNRLASMGVSGLQGYFFMDPVQINNTRISENKLTLMNLLAKVNDEQVDFDQLAEIVMQDPILSHKLLLIINQISKNRNIEFKTHKEAVVYMGLAHFKLWINTLLFNSCDDTPRELLLTSLVRAKFCEQIALMVGKEKEKDSFFLTGLFSNLDVLFKLPMAQVIHHLPLHSGIQRALLEGAGVMGDALNIARFYEAPSSLFGAPEGLQASAKVMATLNKRKDDFDQAYIHACEWVSGLTL